MKSLKRLMAFLLCAIMVLGMAACGGNEQTPNNTDPGNNVDQPEGEEPTGTPKDTVTIGVANDITTLDPQASNTDANMMAFILTHETLVQIDPETSEIIPGLAESWQVSDDGCTFTFTLPSGVTFTDGTPFTANDVKYTYERAKESSFASAKVSDVTEINVIDDTHISVTLSRPNQEFLLLMAHRGMSILSEKLCTEDPTEGPYVGTGMFALEEWLPGDYTSFVRNDNYRGEKAPTRRIVFKLYKEASTRLIALEAGEIDVCIDPSSIDVSHIEEASNLELVHVPNVVMLYLAINTKQPGLDNEHVRKALAYATDKESIIAVSYNGDGIPHNNYINAGQFGLKEDIDVYEYDLEKAQAELEASGYKAGELSFTVMTDNEAKKQAALILQQDLAQIGIELKLEELETAALKGRLNDAALDYELCLYQWTDADGTDFTVRNMYGSTPDESGNLKKNGSNRCNLTDATVNEMIDAALVEQDTAKREQMYNDIEDYLNELCPIVPICTSYINVGIQKGVSGAVWMPTAKHDYRMIVSME